MSDQPNLTISEALLVLDSCRWLKLSASSVSVADYKSREDLAMVTREQYETDPNYIYRASVHIRRAKGQSFEAMLIRAAQMVRSGHVPKHRVKPRTASERCACGGPADVWNEQLKHRLCQRCATAWHRAAFTNDMRPTIGDLQ